MQKSADPKQTGQPTQEQPVSPEPGKLKTRERVMAAMALGKLPEAIGTQDRCFPGTNLWGGHEP